MLAFCNSELKAQSSSDKINLGVVLPDDFEGIDAKAFKMLNTKIEQMLANNGVASNANGNFVILPVINLISNDLIEGGMQNFWKIEMELSLNIVQLTTGKVFGYKTFNLKGSGKSTAEAGKACFGKLNPRDPSLGPFIAESKAKIEDYYVSNRVAIMNAAKQKAAQQEYEEAIASLYCYPQGIQGSNEVNKLLAQLYRQYQSERCGEIIMQAKSALASQNYDEALGLLADIDPASSCASQASALQSQVSRQIRSEQRAAAAAEEADKKRQYNLEQRRISAVENIAKAYYNRRQPTYNVVYNSYRKVVVY